MKPNRNNPIPTSPVRPSFVPFYSKEIVTVNLKEKNNQGCAQLKKQSSKPEYTYYMPSLLDKNDGIFIKTNFRMS